MKRIFAVAALLVASISLFAQAKPTYEIRLWPDGAPTSNELTGPEKDYDGTHVSNVTDPVLYIFVPSNPNGVGILACPGGAYIDVWVGTEGFANAQWYLDQGYCYAVLKYRLPNHHHEVPLDDVHKAMSILKDKAAEYGCDKKLGILGCSAGGHLAAMASTHYTSPENRPDFTILFYPVITLDPTYTHDGTLHNLLGDKPSKKMIKKFSNELCVTPDTPPAFIMGNTDDRVVPVRNSIEYYNALIANGVSGTLHVYPVGGHGWCDKTFFPYREQWMSDLSVWLKSLE